MTRQDAAKLCAVIVAAHPGQSSRLDRDQLTAMADAYAALLSDLEYDTADRAVRALLQTRAWMPGVADIRAAVAELEQGAKRTGAEAWGGVLRAISAEGAHRRPGRDFVFSDPVTARVVAALGWAALCASENQIADRARFIEAYDQIAATARRVAQSPVLEAAERARLGSGGPTAASDAVGLVLSEIKR